MNIPSCGSSLTPETDQSPVCDSDNHDTLSTPINITDSFVFLVYPIQQIVYTVVPFIGYPISNSGVMVEDF